jgi:gliding motility-associated-like protein
VTYEGFEPGTEMACIIVCDDLGVCDTTYIIVTILEMDSDLDAVDDVVTTTQEGTVVIDVFTNDIIPNNTLDTFYIVNEPVLGTAEFDNNGLVTYVHDGEDCDVEDNFTYVICNTFACDTALVTIDIPCDTIPDGEFQIYPGFSPNNDDINETFTITGLGEFPNNRLQVFNRWGNLVYDKAGYTNDWAGTWKGKDLPSGTYFYLLDLGNGEKAMSGYLVLRR